MKEVWPAFEVDHENRIRDDNRWGNLRQATHSQNHANCGTRTDNTTGFKGVQFCKQKQKYIAIAVKDGKRHYAGFHATPEAASVAYEAKAKELHGVFASAA